jgi:carboxyl-terminal processing protease
LRSFLGNQVNRLARATGKRNELADGSALTQKPLVVLINRNTANAAEILAGALQFNQRAVMVGTRSAGQAHTVQSVRSLSDGSGLAFTIAVYEIPGEPASNQQHAIVPDVEVKASSDNPTIISSMGEPRGDNQFEVAKGVLVNAIRKGIER